VAHAPLANGNFARFLCDFSVIQTFVRSDSHFLRSPRPDKTATPVPPMACEGESAHVPKTSTASHCLPAAAKGDAMLPRYIHPQRSLFLYLSLESFLKTIRHHGSHLLMWNSYRITQWSKTRGTQWSCRTLQYKTPRLPWTILTISRRIYETFQNTKVCSVWATAVRFNSADTTEWIWDLNSVYFTNFHSSGDSYKSRTCIGMKVVIPIFLYTDWGKPRKVSQ
jgi:hypothetical protein